MLNDHCHRVSTHLQSINIIIIHNLLSNTSHYTFMHYYCYTSFSPFTSRIIHCIITNHHFLFHLVLSTALHWHLEQTPHSSAFLFSNSPICLLDSRSLRSMFQSCSCDVPSALCTPSCRNACMIFPLQTLPTWRSNWGSSLSPDTYVSRGSISHIYLCFWAYI